MSPSLYRSVTCTMRRLPVSADQFPQLFDTVLCRCYQCLTEAFELFLFLPVSLAFPELGFIRLNGLALFQPGYRYHERFIQVTGKSVSWPVRSFIWPCSIPPGEYERVFRCMAANYCSERTEFRRLSVKVVEYFIGAVLPIMSTGGSSLLRRAVMSSAMGFSMPSACTLY